MATKKRNPQDATLRNIRALKARVAKLERWVAGQKARRRRAEKARRWNVFTYHRRA